MKHNTPVAIIHAKFRCQRVVPLEQGLGAGVLVQFHAVDGDGTEDASWTKATPSGALEMDITNPVTACVFEKGQDYFLDLTPVAVPVDPAEDPYLSLDDLPPHFNGGLDIPLRPAVVSADPGSMLLAGLDGLPDLSRTSAFGDADLGTIPNVTVVDTEAEVDQPGGPAEAWKRIAQTVPAANADEMASGIPDTLSRWTLHLGTGVTAINESTGHRFDLRPGTRIPLDDEVLLRVLDAVCSPPRPT